jgi:hypothetical protein
MTIIFTSHLVTRVTVEAGSMRVASTDKNRGQKLSAMPKIGMIAPSLGDELS